jgi:hypothetical protein
MMFSTRRMPSWPRNEAANRGGLSPYVYCARQKERDGYRHPRGECYPDVGLQFSPDEAVKLATTREHIPKQDTPNSQQDSAYEHLSHRNRPRRYTARQYPGPEPARCYVRSQLHVAVMTLLPSEARRRSSRVEANHEPIAVVLDLVQPLVASRRASWPGSAGKAQ